MTDIGKNAENWIYIGDTNIFYKIDEIVPEPDKKSKETCIRINIGIDYEGIESYFNWIDEDCLEYNIRSDFELVVNKKSIKPNISGSEFRFSAKKFVKDIENNIPSKIHLFHTQKNILFAYPKGNKLRIIIRSCIFEGGKCIFDYTTDKDDFIKQLKRGINKLQKVQYSVNKRIKEYIKENTIIVER